MEVYGGAVTMFKIQKQEERPGVRSPPRRKAKPHVHLPSVRTFLPFATSSDSRQERWHTESRSTQQVRQPMAMHEFVNGESSIVEADKLRQSDIKVKDTEESDR